MSERSPRPGGNKGTLKAEALLNVVRRVATELEGYKAPHGISFVIPNTTLLRWWNDLDMAANRYEQ